MIRSHSFGIPAFQGHSGGRATIHTDTHPIHTRYISIRRCRAPVTDTFTIHTRYTSIHMYVCHGGASPSLLTYQPSKEGRVLSFFLQGADRQPGAQRRCLRDYRKRKGDAPQKSARPRGSLSARCAHMAGGRASIFAPHLTRLWSPAGRLRSLTFGVR